ncbi:MAG: 4-hydroxythreonine-4-phosphate dehydrogenase PdxA, partial [Candidatus Omnitrophica bacterium]|nr:4-hydroxythreonine-4-phosphate dehydrogenase PdxA [Candidatus Omnitrophota bacterium]
MSRHKLTCGITMGDPAGVGPEVVLKALADRKIQRLANFIVIGNLKAWDRARRLSKISLPEETFTLLDIG